MNHTGLTTSAAIAALALSGAVAGCGGDEDPAPPNPAALEVACSPTKATGPTLRADLLIGLSEREAERRAKQKGCGFRVLERDGESLIGTTDYRPNRINAAVRDGKVMRVWIG